MKLFLRFMAFGGILAAGALALGLLTPQRLNSQYASPVNVMNSKTAPALTRDTDNGARAPWLSAVILPSTGTCSSVSDQPVPAGKTLVVEFLTAKLDMEPGAKPLLFSTHPILGGTTELDFPTTFAGNNFQFSGADTYVTSQTTKLYVPSFNSLTWGVCATGGSSQGGRIVVSGYLVNN
jgi:hypothetical protein